MIKLDNDLTYTWKNRSHPRQINLKDRYCNRPNDSLTIDAQGRCFHCMCDGWVPWPSGNLLDFDSIDGIFNNPIANKIQQSTMLGGSFKFCNTYHCGIRNRSKNNTPLYKEINVGIDDSCNLQCPSCRNKLIFYKSGPEYEMRYRLMQHFKTLVENYTQPLHLIIGSNGDAFASKIYKDFLYNLDVKENQTFLLKTNGIQIGKDLFDKKVAQNIIGLNISIDAATEKTYDCVRATGKWNKLLSNLEFVSNNLNTKLFLNFVIQDSNFHEIYQFIDLCKQYNGIPIFSLIEDWGTFSDFSKKSVESCNNRYYNEWKTIKKDLISKGLYFNV